MSKNFPTLKDVAREARVSVSTVSRVSSKHPDVSEETKRIVTEAMETLGYRPSILAQGLVSGHSKTLGLLVSNITNPFYPQLVGAVEEIASKEGYAVFLCNTYEDIERSNVYIDRLLRQGVDGIIHASVNVDDDSLQFLVDQGIPLVLVNRRSNKIKGADVVIFNSFSGARKATKHLIELGHQRIALITGQSYISTERDRINGFRLEMETNHVPVQDKWVIHTETLRENGYLIARELLTSSPRPTAFIANDVVIYGILDAAQEFSLEIPKDLSLIGFGQIDSVNLGRKRFTTISSQIVSMGKISCQRLIEAIINKDHHPSETIIEVDLIDCGSTTQAPMLLLKNETKGMLR